MTKINSELKWAFINLISERTGLQIRESDKQSLEYKIESRMRELNLNSPEEYYNLLKYNTYQGQKEWTQIALLITNTESYFFRDQGQFSLLRNKVIPELIERKKLNKNLRIWSAGCSTGEEPYSIAILLRETIPDIDNWNLTIVATDINQNAIQKAKKGIYNSWSFRLLDPDIQDKYFHLVGVEYQIKRQIREMLSFQYLNLVQDNFPDFTSEIKDMDLIICRNVFIYFNTESIGLVLNKFYDSLQPLGFLLTGHAELYGQNLQKFNTKVFAESLLYQRPKTNRILRPEPTVNEKTKTKTKLGSHGISEPINPFPPVIPVQTSFSPIYQQKSVIVTKSQSYSNPNQLLEKAELLFEEKKYAYALETVKQIIDELPRNFQAYYLMAKIYANMGQYSLGIECCEKALNVDSFSLEPYYLLAHIHEEQGNFEETKRILKKIIYLDDSSLKAYFILGHIYKQEQNFSRARKMYQTMLDILRKLPSSTPIQEWKNISVADLILQVEQELI